MRYDVRAATALGTRYFVAKGVMLKASGELNAGDTQSLCYYFDKVKVDPNLKEEEPSTRSRSLLDPYQTADCVCSNAGIWEAQCPQAIGIYIGREEESGINVRRCGALNGGATSGVCQPGTTQNIYENPAPAITNLCSR